MKYRSIKRKLPQVFNNNAVQPHLQKMAQQSLILAVKTYEILKLSILLKTNHMEDHNLNDNNDNIEQITTKIDVLKLLEIDDKLAKAERPEPERKYHKKKQKKKKKKIC